LVKAQNEIAKLKDELKQISVKMNLDSAYEHIKEVETKRRSGSYRKSKVRHWHTQSLHLFINAFPKIDSGAHPRDSICCARTKTQIRVLH
jgi:hypothetical protein